MTRDALERLDDIAAAIGRIRAIVMRAPALDEVARDAILYNLVIVGEAAKHLSEDARKRRPEIPWRRIAGLRDLLTHEYFRIEIDAIRKIVDRDLPALERAVSEMRRAER